MHTFGSITLLLGMAIVLLAQIVGAILVFNSSVVKGLFSLTIPGYFLFALRRQGIYNKVVGSWGIGILGMVVGTILLS